MDKELELMNEYWQASNYLTACQLYLLDNPLLKRPLKDSDVKEKIVGHWGTCPGQNFIYVHLNRIIRHYNLNMIYLSGPGHGGNAMIAQTYLEGTYSKFYPEISENEAGLQKLFKRFSFPKGVSSHVSPEVPGSIHEGGELGYSLSHAFGAVLDNPTLIAACVVGDGEAETGPLATSWNYNKFLNYKKDGVVLPILHVNGYKIASPTVFGRMDDADIYSFFKGLGYHPMFVEELDVESMHEQMALTMDRCVEEINEYKKGKNNRLPIIIFRSPKGWTCPKEYNDLPIENNFRSHQVPITIDDRKKAIPAIEKWLRSYHPEKLFTETGKLRSDLKKLVPSNPMGMNFNANGGMLLKSLKLPNVDDYAIKVKRGNTVSQDMKVLGSYIRDVYKLNTKNFRLFGPDEALSNRFNYVFENEQRAWNLPVRYGDEFLSDEGRVMDSYLSEHFCEGALEGYILTGRHGILHSYEAFARIIDSMAGQHAKWLKMCNEIPWREKISSLNFILTSHAWQQDHNGYTHQDPGFISHMANKKDEITAVYMPIDTNMLLVCADASLRTKNKINVIVASKHPSKQWLSLEEAKDLFKKKADVLEFASTHLDKEPDIIMACCGDTPTLETIAAIKIMKTFMPKVAIRCVNVVNLMCLRPEDDETLSDERYNELFTTYKPIIFNFHGYPGLIESLTYKRTNHNLHVHGYEEEGTITTAFDMRVINKIDRYHLVLDALNYIDDLNGIRCKKYCEEMLEKHNSFIAQNGIDMPEVTGFKWEG